MTKAAGVRFLTFTWLVFSASAFAPSRNPSFRSSSEALKMSTGETTLIEVISQPDKDFLDKKG